MGHRSHKRNNTHKLQKKKNKIKKKAPSALITAQNRRRKEEKKKRKRWGMIGAERRSWLLRARSFWLEEWPASHFAYHYTIENMVLCGTIEAAAAAAAAAEWRGSQLDRLAAILMLPLAQWHVDEPATFLIMVILCIFVSHSYPVTFL